MKTEQFLRIETRKGEMRRVAAAVAALGQQEQWPPDFIYQITLVIDEIGDNIIAYGHDEGIHEIGVALALEDDAVIIEITDEGRPFDPLHDAPVPDLTSALDERKAGGLGLHLVRSLVDNIQYRREEGKNHLVLIKRKPV